VATQATERKLPSARSHALELQNVLDHDWMASPPPWRSALAEWRSRPPERPRSVISIDPNTDAAAILRRVLNEPIVDDEAEEGVPADHIDDALQTMVRCFWRWRQNGSD
jgi:hypothetical protein